MPRLDLQALIDQLALHRALSVRIDRSPDGVAVTASIGSDYAVDAGGSVVHGGIVATLLDTAATFALIAETDRDWVTIDLRVDYLRPTPLGPVSVTGEVIHAGKRIGRSRASLCDAKGRLCAAAIGTFAPAARD